MKYLKYAVQNIENLHNVYNSKWESVYKIVNL